MKYKVSLGYHKFVIDNGLTALSFAELAKETYVPTKYDETLEPGITLVDDKDEEEGDDDVAED